MLKNVIEKMYTKQCQMWVFFWNFVSRKHIKCHCKSPIVINSYSANRGISRDDIHCVLALTAARAAMHRLVRQCESRL